MTDNDTDIEKTNSSKDMFMSTSYSNNIFCGICGAPLQNIPVMYEQINIDWRCNKCLRRDKPSADDQD